MLRTIETRYTHPCAGQKVETTDEQINCAIYAQWNITQPRKSTECLDAKLWMNLENMTLNERSQTEKLTY